MDLNWHSQVCMVLIGYLVILSSTSLSAYGQGYRKTALEAIERIVQQLEKQDNQPQEHVPTIKNRNPRRATSVPSFKRDIRNTSSSIKTRSLSLNRKQSPIQSRPERLEAVGMQSLRFPSKENLVDFEIVEPESENKQIVAPQQDAYTISFTTYEPEPQFTLEDCEKWFKDLSAYPSEKFATGDAEIIQKADSLITFDPSDMDQVKLICVGFRWMFKKFNGEFRTISELMSELHGGFFIVFKELLPQDYKTNGIKLFVKLANRIAPLHRHVFKYTADDYKSWILDPIQYDLSLFEHPQTSLMLDMLKASDFFSMMSKQDNLLISAILWLDSKVDKQKFPKLIDMLRYIGSLDYDVNSVPEPIVTAEDALNKLNSYNPSDYGDGEAPNYNEPNLDTYVRWVDNPNEYPKDKFWKEDQEIKSRLVPRLFFHSLFAQYGSRNKMRAGMRWVWLELAKDMPRKFEDILHMASELATYYDFDDCDGKPIDMKLFGCILDMAKEDLPVELELDNPKTDYSIIEYEQWIQDPDAYPVDQLEAGDKPVDIEAGTILQNYTNRTSLYELNAGFRWLWLKTRFFCKPKFNDINDMLKRLAILYKSDVQLGKETLMDKFDEYLDKLRTYCQTEDEKEMSPAFYTAAELKRWISNPSEYPRSFYRNSNVELIESRDSDIQLELKSTMRRNSLFAGLRWVWSQLELAERKDFKSMVEKVNLLDISDCDKEPSKLFPCVLGKLKSPVV